MTAPNEAVGQVGEAGGVLARSIPVPEAGCYIWPNSGDQKGYGRVRHQGRTWAAHRLAWTQANGSIPPGMLVCHKCDTPPCVNPDHLFLGTALENSRDRDRKGRQRTGNGRVQNLIPQPKALAAEDEAWVVWLALNNCRQLDIAKHFGCSQGTVSNVIAAALRAVGAAK